MPWAKNRDKRESTRSLAKEELEKQVKTVHRLKVDLPKPKVDGNLEGITTLGPRRSANIRSSECATVVSQPRNRDFGRSRVSKASCRNCGHSNASSRVVVMRVGEVGKPLQMFAEQVMVWIQQSRCFFYGATVAELKLRLGTILLPCSPTKGAASLPRYILPAMRLTARIRDPSLCVTLPRRYHESRAIAGQKGEALFVEHEYRPFVWENWAILSTRFLETIEGDILAVSLR
ncbi:hypothetical protein V8C35DRAFT_155840 [Trichoderma chlorosporum]